MRELTGNLWDARLYEVDWRVVTTNGNVRQNGELVMGAGVALEAKQRYPDLPGILGEWVKYLGNIPCVVPKYRIVSFPTKHDWWEKSSLELIQKSAQILKVRHEAECAGVIVLPRPGCGHGGLRWEDVKPILEPLFDDDFIVVSP